MPIYGMTLKQMDKVKKWQVCAVCQSRLEILYDLIKHEPYLACHADQTHEGIAKAYENREYNIATRREFMEKEFGEQKTRALEKYSATTSLTKQDADTIIDTIWPGARAASPAEVFKAVSICALYGLNPLMRHLYLIPFWNKDKKAHEYVTVMGIGANRLIASRKHAYSYIDDTPRLMSDDEQTRIFGDMDIRNLRAITILKDMKTGASARGYGSWPKDTEPKGTDKGNSKANMAFIRSERQALDRLYPADMPHDVEVVDERYEVMATVEPPTIPAPGDVPAEMVKEAPQEPPVVPSSTSKESTPEASKAEAASESPPATSPAKVEESTKSLIDLGWVTETLRIIRWSDATLKSWVKSQKWAIKTDAPLVDVLKALNLEQTKTAYDHLAELREAAGK